MLALFAHAPRYPPHGRWENRRVLDHGRGPRDDVSWPRPGGGPGGGRGVEWERVSPVSALAGRRITGRSHPITAGTCTRTDAATRTGRVTRSSAARRCSAAVQAAGAGRVPITARRPAAIHPDASRRENATTPATHSTTISGSAGSSVGRTRAASRSTRAAGPASVGAGHGDAPYSDSAVTSGSAAVKTNVAVAQA